MKQTLTLIMNDASPTKAYRVKVFAFVINKQTGKADYKDISHEVYENATQAVIQNVVAGNRNVPQVDFDNGVIFIHLKDDSLNAFYQYYRQFFHSCIPQQYVGDSDMYLLPSEFEGYTGVSTKVRKDRDKRLAEAWLKVLATGLHVI